MQPADLSDSAWSDRADADAALAPYACDPVHSRGRRFAATKSPPHEAFAHDRERIVHSSAFRRLGYKTQVFLNHEGDLFRTRLTHSLEVAQLARRLARTLRLNEDLVEAIALAHDLGHTPFGHAGQDELNLCMAVHADCWDGFEHNLHGLRVVDQLEQRYPEHDGLNLSFETREGILKHCSMANARALEAIDPGGVAARFLPPAAGQPGRTQPSLEAQLCNLADQIAYVAHDIDDGVRAGLLSIEQLQELSLFESQRCQALAAFPDLQGRRLLFETLRRLLAAQSDDLIAATRTALQQVSPDSVEAVRRAPPLLCFGAAMQQQSAAVQHFLWLHLYRHPQVMQTTERARVVVRELFAAYLRQPAQMPADFARRPDHARAVADYIAGMTDRFAAQQHQRLSGQRLLA